ncbi:MAG: hypothetical protein WAM81_10290 [Acidimicrobiia bacterium]
MWIFSLLAGVAAAVVDTGVMVPLEFPTADAKRQAMIAAFIERFFLGFMIGPVAAGLGANGIAIGALLGVGASLGTSIITRTWAPIIGMGFVTGILVGVAYELVF